MLNYLLTGNIEVKTKHGKRYRLTAEAIETIKEDFSSLYFDTLEADVSVADIDIRSDAEKHNAAVLASKAGSDGDFRKFLDDLIPKNRP